MNNHVTLGAEGDQVLLAVFSAVTAVDEVMDLQLIAAAAALASPAIPLENLPPQPCIAVAIESGRPSRTRPAAHALFH